MKRVILHIDMDAFFAQVEQVKNPALRGKPIIVGGDAGHRGVVATCSYEARKYGIHSAMSSAEARRRCPHAIFVGGNLTNYVYISAQIQDIMNDYTPIVEPTSIDEAYLDITESYHLYGTPEKLAQDLKDNIKKRLQLTCTVGIAENKLLAKTASDMNKPDGLNTLWMNELEEKFFPMEIRKLRGVGPQTEKALKRLGINTLRDLKDYPEKKLSQNFGLHGEHLSKMAHGLSDTPVHSFEEMEDEKSMSHEHTLYEDTSDLIFLKSLMITLTDKVVARLKKAQFLAKTVRLKIRYSDFSTITREVTLNSMTDDVNTIYKTALTLLPVDDVVSNKVRLVGVGVTKLHEAVETPQIELFEESSISKKGKSGDVVEDIRDKFGKFSIVRASSLPYRWEH
ncbi:MAG: DNA polymerase IV [candidate division Zixibacteria bacterium]|nr:DNA polymerase IV [candidate division Zixibacteria bacterium]